tara:strand:- start:86 stop:607 length:522 start_codon:yes stop_codon:yes gene_type:complete
MGYQWVNHALPEPSTVAIGAMQIYGAILTVVVIVLLYILIQRNKQLRILEEQHKSDLKNVRKDSTNRQRGILKGQISELIAPWLLKSVDSVKELNFLGNPIDFIGFKGLDGDGEVDIKLIEVKTGKSRLNKNQKRVKEAVESNRVSWVEVKIETDAVIESGLKITENSSNGNE